MSTSLHAPRRAMPRWVVPATLAVGLLLVVGGGVTLWRSLHRATFGWFAYSPMSETISVQPGGQWIGIWLLIAGALVLGAVGGFVVGRRTR